MKFSSKNFPRQSGFSIIELMIAMTVTMVLTAGVALLYTSGRASARNQSEQGRLLETGRNAMYILTRSIQHGGYLADPVSWIDAQIIFPNGSRPVQGTEGAAGSSDTLTVTYQGSGPSAGTADLRVVNCLGDAVPFPLVSYPASPATIRRDVFTIANDATNNNEPTLFCDDGTGANTVALVSGIEALQVLYGEDTDNPRDLNANRYVLASGVSNWFNVVSVRISLLARSPTASVALNPVARNFDLLGTSFAAPADGRMRQVFTTVVNVRNLSN